MIALLSLSVFAAVGDPWIGPAARLDRNIVGDDDTVEVADPLAWPHVTAARLSVTWATGRRTSCSGTLVGPSHLLTAGHCVYNTDRGGFATAIEVVVAADRDLAPFGVQRAARLAVWGPYPDTGATADDMGFVLLDDDVGNDAGWLGLKPDTDDALGAVAAITAFPGGDVADTRTAVHSRGTIGEVGGSLLYYDTDTDSGGSGAGVWDPADARLWGNHATGLTLAGVPTRNAGPRLTPERYAAIVAWIAETTPVPPDPPTDEPAVSPPSVPFDGDLPDWPMACASAPGGTSLAAWAFGALVVAVRRAPRRPSRSGGWPVR